MELEFTKQSLYERFGRLSKPEMRLIAVFCFKRSKGYKDTISGYLMEAINDWDKMHDAKLPGHLAAEHVMRAMSRWPEGRRVSEEDQLRAWEWFVDLSLPEMPGPIQRTIHQISDDTVGPTAPTKVRRRFSLE